VRIARAARIFAGLNRISLPPRKSVSQTDPCPTRTESPPSPKNCWTTELVAGSIRVSGICNIVTQTDPSPAEISPPPPGRPASIVATSFLVLMSTREILPSP